MNFESEFLSRFATLRTMGKTFPIADFALMCHMALDPVKRFESKHVADVLGMAYAGGWTVMQRLERAGIAKGGRLTEAGRAVMGFAPDWRAPEPVEVLLGQQEPEVVLDEADEVHAAESPIEVVAALAATVPGAVPAVGQTNLPAADAALKGPFPPPEDLF